MKKESGAIKSAFDFVENTKIFKLTLNDNLNKWYIEFTSQYGPKCVAYQKGMGSKRILGHQKENTL